MVGRVRDAIGVAAVVSMCCLCAWSGIALAQPLVKLGAPERTYAHEFTEIAGVREQSDGVLIVVDKRDLKIWRVTGPTATPVSLGRQGMGPGEYQAPFKIVALPGDSTAILDAFGDGRIHLVTRAGLSKEALAVGALKGRELAPLGELQSDAAGNLYDRTHTTRVENGKRLVSDSLGVRRVLKATRRVDTVGRYWGKIRSPLFKPISATDRDVTNAMVRANNEPLPFFTHDAWAVSQSGRLAFVSADPYQVRFRDPSGQELAGAPIRFAAVPVDDALKAEWRAAEGRPSLTMTYSGDGKTSIGFRTRKVVEPPRWPDVLPAFPPDAFIRFDPDGRLWVQRSVAAGKAPRFDVIDDKGVVVRQVELPKRSRLVGFGAKTLYLAHLDDDDIERLERYPRR